MKTKRKIAGVVAVAIAVLTIFSPKSIVNADEKSNVTISFENEIGITEISPEDSAVIREAFDYAGEGNTKICICTENTSAWVNWEKSNISRDEIISIEVFCPVLSRDENDKLIVKKDREGMLEYNYYLYNDSGDARNSGKELYFIADSDEDMSHYLNSCMGTSNFYIPPYEWGAVSPDAGKAVPLTDAYVIRITYVLKALERGGYADFWILPESVLTSTVLKIEDGNFSKTSSSGEWIKDNIGWWYKNQNGTYPADEWKLINGKWYYFDKVGYMKTGWILSNNVWYYLNKDGSMAVNCTTPDGYTVDENGAWIK